MTLFDWLGPAIGLACALAAMAAVYKQLEADDRLRREGIELFLWKTDYLEYVYTTDYSKRVLVDPDEVPEVLVNAFAVIAMADEWSVQGVGSLLTHPTYHKQKRYTYLIESEWLYAQGEAGHTILRDIWGEREYTAFLDLMNKKMTGILKT